MNPLKKKVLYLNQIVLLMPGSVIEAANSATLEIYTDSSIDEDSPTPRDKVKLKTICGKYQMFTDKEKAEFVRSG